MIVKYLTIALRSMMRNKAYTAINILGFSAGVAGCLLLSFYINHEPGYDQRHRNESENRIMRTSAPAEGLPETPVGRHNDKLLHESNGLTADPTQFEISPYQLRSGNPKKALV